MKYAACSVLALACAAAGLSTPGILVYHDEYEGYGTAVLEAIGNIWPECVPEVYTGMEGQDGFNSALTAGDWDIVVLECWYAGTDGIDWYQVRSEYDQGDISFFVYNWHWYDSSAGQFQLYNAMGVTDVVPSTYMLPINIWEPDHPLVLGISDWSQHDMEPYILIKTTPLLVDDAFPVTGWSEFEEGICVANDGRSVISGYCPAYSVEGVAIWENILNFLWDPGPLDQSTWGGIKSAF